MQGKCLCGAVELSAPDHNRADVCHCSMCRRWSGGPLFTVHCTTGVEVKGDALKTYQSSDWVERGFCSQCGTHLFTHVLAGDDYFVLAGLFQDREFSLVNEIFIDEKPDYYALSNETHKMTGQQVYEQFSQS